MLNDEHRSDSQTQYDWVFLLLAVLFIFVNSIKIDCIDHFLLFPDARILIMSPSLKLLAYILVNTAIFIAIMRLRSRLFFIGLYSIRSFYWFLHCAYILYFDTPFHTRQLLAEIHEGASLVQHASIPFNIKYLVVFIDLPLAVLIVLYFSRIRKLLFLRDKLIRWVLAGLAALSVYFIPLFYNIYSISGKVRDPLQGELMVIEKLGLAGNDILDFFVYNDEGAIIKNFTYGQAYNRHNQFKKPAANIICIQVESLDANVIHGEYKGKYITPYLHKLSGDSVFYPYTGFYHLAGGTADTEFSVMNGIVPANDFPSFKLRWYNYPNSITKQFLKNGYSTVAFHDNYGDFFNRKYAFLNMGFQKFYDLKDMRLAEFGWGGADGEMFKFIENKLLKQKKPFFYYVITMSSHLPFSRVRDYYHNQEFDDIKDAEVANYFNACSYVDSVLGQFVTFVQHNFKNTYIFIYGDHNVYALYGHATGYKNVGVPLFIITPDHKVYSERNKEVSILDLPPTILMAAGIHFSTRTLGTDLLAYPIVSKNLFLVDGSAADRQKLFGRDLNVNQ